MHPLSSDVPCVFVIGGSAGIGRAIAQALMAEGAQVVVFSRSDPLAYPGLEGAHWWPLDLTRGDDSRRELARAVNRFGSRLAAVFYSAVAYGPRRAPLLEVLDSQWREQLATNLEGLWHTLSATLPALLARPPGLFVGLSSEVVYNGGPLRAGYAATKAAASNLLQSVAQEYPESQVRVVQLLPAEMVDTPGIRKRRDASFDCSRYMNSACFQTVAVQLYRTRGFGAHGRALVVDAHSQVRDVNQHLPASQSRQPT